jgi:hypothetical protein
MKAKLLYYEKYIYTDGSIREMVLWQLPKKSDDKPHGFKYRLYYGLPDGRCLVRYDNEKGKGDHRHTINREEPYQFKNVERLVADFLSDITTAREE